MKLRLLFCGLVFASFAFTACSEEDECDPETDADCVCTLDSDGSVVNDCIDNETDAGEGCSCETTGAAANNQANNQPANNQPANNQPANNQPAPDPFLFVMVTDTTPNPSGDTPGADVDAIGLIKADGTEVFAATIESDDLDCTNNTACDTNGILGAPDVVDNGECFGGGGVDTTLFTALNASRVVVSFDGGAEVENGDSIHVYEIGATECGRFDNDPFSVSVGVSDDLDGTFIVIGDGGDGNNIIPVSGL
jgi:hypothetical protein